MVLFVARVDERVPELAARNMAVVADGGLIDACPFADADLLTDKDIGQESAGVEVRTPMYNGVAQDDSGTDAGGLIRRGIDVGVLDFATT